jgi:hypothetical protein
LKSNDHLQLKVSHACSWQEYFCGS